MTGSFLIKSFRTFEHHDMAAFSCNLLGLLSTMTGSFFIESFRTLEHHDMTAFSYNLSGLLSTMKCKKKMVLIDTNHQCLRKKLPVDLGVFWK
jgi:hypothetical protein